MRTLVHLSDLHFGAIDEALLAPLAQAVADARPDLVVVSGDLTQRARTRQFRAAAAWLRTLPGPQLVVPGNHDVPLYDVLRRFMAPLVRFRRHIEDQAFPYYEDGEIAAIGINTARSLTFKGGRINREQVTEVARRFGGLPESVTRIVVSHHPFDLPEGAEASDLVGRAGMAMEAFSGCGADLFLSGHLHRTHAGNTARRYAIDGFAALVVQAGTAASTRGRGEANAFNLLHIGATDMALETLAWNREAGRFLPFSRQAFDYVHRRGWAPRQ
ncbi:MAG: metallophosphoesterase [Pseudomonadota bacterium]|nr:metallophosphoesterase [Pseudomonadota bacterium]